jgi:tetratricopeptide (TPR) repeat protein/tRNA A-37 threonylcarbamoyl transferase component Bud32
MLSSLKTRALSGQQWLTVQFQRGDQSTAEREKVRQDRQDAFDALQLVERASLGFDYLQSADVVAGHLHTLQRSITSNLEDGNPAEDDFRDWHLLGRIHEYLGDYRQAYKCYSNAFRLVPPTEGCAFVRRDFASFLANTGQRLALFQPLYRMNSLAGEKATEKGGVMADGKTSASWYQDSPEAVEDGEILSLALCYNDDYLGALVFVNKAKELSMRYHRSITPKLSLCWALASAGLKDRERAETEFLRAYILSAVNMGNWHTTTLSVLHEYGCALLGWEQHAAATALLTECYIARIYRLGPNHPSAQETYKNLKECTLSKYQRKIVQVFRASPSYAALRSLAYEHMELWTIANILDSLDGEPFPFAEKLVEYLLEDPGIRFMQTTNSEGVAKRVLRLKRAMAACASRLGNHAEAASLLKLFLHNPGPVRVNNTMTLQCKVDRAIYLSKASKKGGKDPKVQELTQYIFFESDPLLENYQHERFALASAFRRRLTAHNLTHFEWGHVPSLEVSPFTTIDKIGMGSSAYVESVSLKEDRYAQKVFILKGPSANQLKKQVKDEVSVLQRLEHPHIVQIFCTFEEKNYFAMVMQPLAAGDLEVFLSRRTGTLELSPLVEKWLGCLAVTLSFLHSHGVKHRDIKPRNILVNGGRILFSDFGSSRDCSLESGMSTDGPAYGHTKIYSAIEVIEAEKRNETADVFSLGCVFTEMVSALCGRSPDCYDRFRGSVEHKRMPYYQSLDRVESWFMDEEQMPIWGRKMYLSFIKPMLAATAEDRPSAEHTAVAMHVYFKEQNFAAETSCQECFQYCLAKI